MCGVRAGVELHVMRSEVAAHAAVRETGLERKRGAVWAVVGRESKDARSGMQEWVR